MERLNNSHVGWEFCTGKAGDRKWDVRWEMGLEMGMEMRMHFVVSAESVLLGMGRRICIIGNHASRNFSFVTGETSF